MFGPHYFVFSIVFLVKPKLDDRRAIVRQERQRTKEMVLQRLRAVSKTLSFNEVGKFGASSSKQIVALFMDKRGKLGLLETV